MRLAKSGTPAEVLAEIDQDSINQPFEKKTLYLNALDAAVFYGNIPVVRALVDSGADIHVTGEFGKTLMHQAAWGGHVETIALLHEMGLDIDARAQTSGTPLGVAIFAWHTEAALWFLEHGANPNGEVLTGESFLGFAILSGRVVIARALLDRGVRLGQRDWHLSHYYEMAAGNEDREMVELLTHHEAFSDEIERYLRKKTELEDKLSSDHLEMLHSLGKEALQPDSAIVLRLVIVGGWDSGATFELSSDEHGKKLTMEKWKWREYPSDFDFDESREVRLSQRKDAKIQRAIRKLTDADMSTYDGTERIVLHCSSWVLESYDNGNHQVVERFCPFVGQEKRPGTRELIRLGEIMARSVGELQAFKEIY